MKHQEIDQLLTIFGLDRHNLIKQMPHFLRMIKKSDLKFIKKMNISEDKTRTQDWIHLYLYIWDVDGGFTKCWDKDKIFDRKKYAQVLLRKYEERTVTDEINPFFKAD